MVAAQGGVAKTIIVENGYSRLAFRNVEVHSGKIPVPAILPWPIV